MADDKESLAGEYVLGTLSAAERAEVEARLATDAELAAAVRDWERRLAPLTDAVPEVSPPPGLWGAIEAKLGEGGPRASGGEPAAQIVRLRRRIRIWQGTTAAAGALAAALALAVFAGPALNPSAGPTRFVGVVNRGGELPALIVEVDTRSGVVGVRSVSAEPPAGRSFELWYIGEGRRPLSVGLVDAPGASLRLEASRLPGFTAASATFAVTEEPRGGAPGGVPTGPVVFSGKLIPAPD